jgi:hypothetical protein
MYGGILKDFDTNDWSEPVVKPIEIDGWEMKVLNGEDISYVRLISISDDDFVRIEVEERDGNLDLIGEVQDIVLRPYELKALLTMLPLALKEEEE